jgi:hypothetical protein
MKADATCFLRDTQFDTSSSGQFLMRPIPDLGVLKTLGLVVYHTPVFDLPTLTRIQLALYTLLGI